MYLSFIFANYISEKSLEQKILVLLVLLISVLKLFWNISKVFGFKSSQFLLILNSKASHNRAILRQKQRKIAQKSFPRSCIIYSKLGGMWSVSFLLLLFVAKCKLALSSNFPRFPPFQSSPSDLFFFHLPYHSFSLCSRASTRLSTPT